MRFFNVYINKKSLDFIHQKIAKDKIYSFINKNDIELFHKILKEDNYKRIVEEFNKHNYRLVCIDR